MSPSAPSNSSLRLAAAAAASATSTVAHPGGAGVVPTPAQAIASVIDALATNGFKANVFADVELRILNSTFLLHRMILYACPLFRVAIDASVQSATGLTVQRYSRALRKNAGRGFSPAEIPRRHVLEISVPPSVTLAGVTAVLERLYGVFGQKVTEQNLLDLLPAAHFFSDEPLCDDCAAFISTLPINADNVMQYFNFASAHDFGPYSELLLRNCLIFLCQEGANQALIQTHYAKLDVFWISSIVCSDVFNVKGEAHRFEFLLKCLDSKENGSIVEKIRMYLGGSEIMGWAGLGIMENVSGNSRAASALGIPHDPDDPKDDDGTENSSSDIDDDAASSVPTTATTVRNRDSFYDSSKRLSFLENISENDGDAIVPSQPLRLHHTNSRNKIFVTSPLSFNPPPGPPPQIVQKEQSIPELAKLLAAARPETPQQASLTKLSFHQRRSLIQAARAAEHPTAAAIDVISNGIIYTHMQPSTLSRLKTTGIISPLVISTQSRISTDFAARVKKAGGTGTRSGANVASSLGLTYFNDALSGGLQQILSQYSDDPASETSEAPSFYEWLFLDPFRHRASDVPPFRFGFDIPLARICAGSGRGRCYSEPVAYGGSIWYLMVRGEVANTNGSKGRLGVFLYRKQDRKRVSGYSDVRSAIEVRVKVCAYLHQPSVKIIPTEPYAFEAALLMPTGKDIRFNGEVNRLVGEDLMNEIGDLSTTAGGRSGDYSGVLRCAVVLGLL
ncbi:hypothetical protein HDU82_003676 [Entophlyctis luteolus]|nr:hypothetical protein HDU82_003676 [Entophlyctis luteolus]